MEGQLVVIDTLLQAAPYLKEMKNNSGKLSFDVASSNRDVRR